MNRVHWEIVPRGDVSTNGARLYVSINKEGYITFNSRVFERLGKPAAVLLMFDRLNSRIALKPTAKGLNNAYPIRTRNNRGSRIVRAARLLIEYGLQIPDLLEFKGIEFDRDGLLVLDLRTARASNRGTKRGNTYPKKTKPDPAT
jgi:hypothetical protein